MNPIISGPEAVMLPVTLLLPAELIAEFKETNVLLERIAVGLERGAAALETLAADPPVSARIVLGQPTKGSPSMKVQLNFKKGTKRGADLPFPQLASDGATLTAFDSAGNPTAIDPTKTSVTWSTSDSTVLTITPSSTDQTQATAKSTGKVGTGVTITATFVNLDGSAPMPPAVSVGIDVPAGTPASATISLGVPA